jgi:hypothetical protein
VIPFHKLLIATGIAFCGGFALWAAWQFVSTRSPASLVLAAIFVGLTLALLYYLRHLKRFIGR